MRVHLCVPASESLVNAHITLYLMPSLLVQSLKLQAVRSQCKVAALRAPPPAALLSHA